MIIQSKNVYFEEKLQPLQIQIEGDKIVKIAPYNNEVPDRDYGENWILPGLIDIHNHGYLGNDSNSTTKQWLKQWMAYLPSEGVTSTLPSIYSGATKEDLCQSMRTIAEVVKEGYEGTHILGIYSEGPFISERFKGAQSLKYQLIPTVEIIDEFLGASEGLLNYVMLAPEMLENMDVIRYCVKKGIKVAIGHSGATFEKCSEARNAGAKSFTHTYNGMLGLHHREAGTVGAAMYYDDMYAELIGDGIHVSFPAGNILAKTKGKDKLISVTDSIDYKGYPVGEYMVGDQKMFICEDGVERLEDGTLAGSTNKLNVILYREIYKANIPAVTAINSVTCNPATLLGFDYCKGYIKENYDADIAVFDKDMNAIQTYVSGKEML